MRLKDNGGAREPLVEGNWAVAFQSLKWARVREGHSALPPWKPYPQVNTPSHTPLVRLPAFTLKAKFPPYLCSSFGEIISRSGSPAASSGGRGWPSLLNSSPEALGSCFAPLRTCRGVEEPGNASTKDSIDNSSPPGFSEQGNHRSLLGGCCYYAYITITITYD